MTLESSRRGWVVPLDLCPLERRFALCSVNFCLVEREASKSEVGEPHSLRCGHSILLALLYYVTIRILGLVMRFL